MSRLEQRLIDGHVAAKAQRARLKARLAATRDRLILQRLLNDARAEAERQVRTTASDAVAEVKAHPVRTALLGGAVLAWIFRHPLMDHGPQWIKRAYNLVAGRLALADDNVGIAIEIGDADGVHCDAEPCAIDTVQQNDSQ
jgi:hypothetical protein